MIATVLIADDSKTARMIMKRCLEIVGFTNVEFVQAENGREAVHLAKERKVDLVVSDINMPEMSGIELVQWMKGRPSTHEIPIVMVTSLANPALEEKLMAMGVVAVLKKPLTPTELFEVLGPFLNPEEDGDDNWGGGAFDDL
ncbi:MAG: response regulator [Candidatus Wallbacteria bacterium HGW-Wallbacteria-1]|jgi:two-component system chemotaxis response regulator CheY|uniref:Response regulator n=1 Tax=Candidatus Wallbacteria bacterium HGW-Wallbacteria-1 TaxID=2013854 RepID=A0A2N1PIZ1_9BACT|nr:MAG: response regulator [Candidatus Wallbacteria bacterium HGW-Wallbacteria-1]